MKKFLATLAVLSMSAVLFTACNTGEEKKAEEAAPAVTEEAPVVVPESTDAAAVDAEVKVDAAAEAVVE